MAAVDEVLERLSELEQQWSGLKEQEKTRHIMVEVTCLRTG